MSDDIQSEKELSKAEHLQSLANYEVRQRKQTRDELRTRHLGSLLQGVEVDDVLSKTVTHGKTFLAHLIGAATLVANADLAARETDNE